MFPLDQQLYEKGIRIVAGCDEAGRGALAGPLVVAAVVFDLTKPIPEVRDSKRMSAAQREKALQEIRRTARAIGIGESTPAEIDCVGIDQATIMAAKRALANFAGAEALVCDRFRVPGYDGYQLNPDHAENKSVAVAAASIVAKTYRDRIMDALDRIEPAYTFSHHKGYPTAFHLERLRALGPTGFHRKSYRPVREMLGNI